MNAQRIFKPILFALLVALIAFGSVGMIYAQDGGRGPRNGGPRWGDGPHHLIEMIAEMTGTDAEAVMQARQGGQSLNDYLTANGVDPAEVIAAVLAEFDERTSEAVAEGRLTEEAVTTRRTDLETRLAEVMASTDPLPQGNLGYGFGPRGPKLLEALSEVLGVDVMTLHEQLEAGQTPAEIIEANGGDVAEVATALEAVAVEHINEAVAEGWLTQEKADEMLATITEHVEAFLNGERLGEGFGGPGRGGPGRGRGPNDGSPRQNQGNGIRNGATRSS